jgi:predicted nucleic acid-binding protein
VTTPDSSVVVAAFTRWHEHHDRARAALQEGTQLIAHVAVETYAILTRLPPPRRVPAELASRLLAEHFGRPSLVLKAAGYQTTLQLAAEHGLAGGSVHDAVIAATALSAGVTIVTLDERAAATYRLVGADYELLLSPTAVA